MARKKFLFATAIAGAVLAASVSAQAQRNRAGESCSMVLRVEGGFTYRPDPTLSVIARTAGPGPLDRTGLPDNLVGFSCVRRSQVPEIDDLEVLQSGLDLYLGAGSTLRIVALELVEGRVTWSMQVGALSRSEQRQTEAAVAAMQARLAAGA